MIFISPTKRQFFLSLCVWPTEYLQLAGTHCDLGKYKEPNGHFRRSIATPGTKDPLQLLLASFRSDDSYVFFDVVMWAT